MLVTSYILMQSTKRALQCGMRQPHPAVVENHQKKEVSTELISHAASEAIMMKTAGMSLMDDKKYINYKCLLQYSLFFFFRKVNRHL